MSWTLYDSTIPTVSATLKSLQHLLTKIEEHSKANSVDANTLITAKLYENMFGLIFQVHMVTDTCSKIIARLTEAEPASYSMDDLKTLDDLKARVQTVQDVVAKVESDPAAKETISSMADKNVTFNAGPDRKLTTTGGQYVLGYGMPNIFFHLTTVYAIMRKEGVDIGKLDYLTPYISPYVSM